jgi:hypothetical protein
VVFDATTQFGVFYSNAVNVGSTNQSVADPVVIEEEEQGNQQNFDRIPWYSVFQLVWSVFVELLQAKLLFKAVYQIFFSEQIDIAEKKGGTQDGAYFFP